MSPTPSTTVRRAFTLVELLAVLVIIGMLLGLLLPAVSRARESARQSQCKNNLRQMGVALTNHEQAKKRFPPGNDQIGRRFHAWSSYILPFLEQANVSSQIDYTKPWDDPGGNAALADLTIPTYVCPSGMKMFPGKQDYGGVLGAYINATGESLSVVNDKDLRFLSSGVLYATGEEMYVPPKYDRGTVPGQQPRVSAKASQISDGLAKTLIVTEGVDREQVGVEDTRRSGDSGWASGFNCFPLNHRVINIPDSDGFRCMHMGGIHGLFADGRVQFLGENLDASVLIAITTKAGGEADSLGM